MTGQHAVGIRFLALAVLVALPSAGAQAQTADNAAEQGGSSTAISAAPGDLWLDIEALPTTENAWWLVGGAALAITVHQFEDPDGAADALNKGLLDPISDFGNIWGDMRVQVPLAVGAWGLGSMTDNRAMAELGYDLSRGLLLSYGVVSLIKVGVNRTRPNGDDYSFPSGHTAAAFTTAGVVWERCGGGWAGWSAVALGVTTAMCRMEDHKHFASDVAAGATIGWIVGRTAGRERHTGGVSWQLVPAGAGLAVAGNF